MSRLVKSQSGRLRWAADPGFVVGYRLPGLPRQYAGPYATVEEAVEQKADIEKYEGVSDVSYWFKSWAGQCFHSWVRATDGAEVCARKGCGATCRRDDRGRIVDYSVELPKPAPQVVGPRPRIPKLAAPKPPAPPVSVADVAAALKGAGVKFPAAPKGKVRK